MRSLETFTVDLKYRQANGWMTSRPTPPSATLPTPFAEIYGMKADSANREIMSRSPTAVSSSMYYLRARTREDLRRPMRAHRMIADIPNLRALWPEGSLAARRTTSRAL
jgi:hypothetical protein